MKYLINITPSAVILYIGIPSLLCLQAKESVEYNTYVIEDSTNINYNLNIINNYIQNDILSVVITLDEGSTVVDPGYVEPGYFGD